MFVDKIVEKNNTLCMELCKTQYVRMRQKITGAALKFWCFAHRQEIE